MTKSALSKRTPAAPTFDPLAVIAPPAAPNNGKTDTRVTVKVTQKGQIAAHLSPEALNKLHAAYTAERRTFAVFGLSADKVSASAVEIHACNNVAADGSLSYPGLFACVSQAPANGRGMRKAENGANVRDGGPNGTVAAPIDANDQHATRVDQVTIVGYLVDAPATVPLFDQKGSAVAAQAASVVLSNGMVQNVAVRARIADTVLTVTRCRISSDGFVPEMSDTDLLADAARKAEKHYGTAALAGQIGTKATHTAARKVTRKA